MNELIKIDTNHDGQQLVNARNLHEFLEVKKDFSDWIKYQTESLDLIEDEDFSPILGRSEAGRQTIEYALTLDTAKHISLASRCEKGKQARKYFIEVEKQYKLQIPPQLSTLDFLKIAIKDLEKKEASIQEKNKQIAVMKPNHEFVNRIFKTAETNVKIGDFAQASAIPDPKYPKTIIGQKKMFRLLRSMGILKDNNMPKTEYQNRGYFEVIERIKEDINKVFFTTYVTPKGQAWLHKQITETLGV